MEENQPKIGKFSWTYGLLLGLASVAFNVMLYTMDMHYEQGWGIRIVGLVLMLAAIVFGIMQYKNANSGFLKTVEGVKLGAGIGLVAAIIGLIYYALLTNVIEPDFMDKAMDIAKVGALESNPQMTDEQWQQGVDMQKKFAWLAYPFVILFNIIVGLIIGGLTGLIMKNPRPE
jgi:hypothetical protein